MSDIASADGLAVIERLREQVWNRGDLSRLNEVISAEFVDHRLDWEEDLELGDDMTGGGYAGFEARIRKIRNVFPDCHVTSDALFAAEDHVVWRWTLTGTYQHLLHPNYPSIGHPVVVRGISIYRIADGLVVERWVSQDVRGLLRQIGGD